MPDPNGWPTASDVIDRLTILSPIGITDDMKSLVEMQLPALIAEFQSPPGRNGNGGTGRNFTPITETRFYDGNGYPELTIEDMVPGSALSVTAFGTAVPTVIMKRPKDPSQGWNVIAFQPSGGYYPYAGYTGLFPIGIQNIGVTTTFAFAAMVPPDVNEAILSEQCYRVLVEGFVGVDGFGEVIKMGSFQFDSSVGSSQFQGTSSLSVLHTRFVNARSRYRLHTTQKLKELRPRMA